MTSLLTMALPRGFDLRLAVCSYGFYLLAPNRWDDATASLSRPLRGEGDRVIAVNLRVRSGRLHVACEGALSPGDRSMLRRQVARMLRLDEDFTGWFRRHRPARQRGFARLFRSPTLFEDMVKTFSCCNVTWKNTLTMNRLLCEQHGGGAFPTPRELAQLRPATLRRTCKVGYRADRIVRLARDFTHGRWRDAWFEDPTLSTDTLVNRLRAVHGVGPYAAANLCQLLGRYDRLAIDSETYRHFCRVEGIPRPDRPAILHDRIEARYARFAPYQFLAYWYELWTGSADP